MTKCEKEQIMRQERLDEIKRYETSCDFISCQVNKKRNEISDSKKKIEHLQNQLDKLLTSFTYDIILEGIRQETQNCARLKKELIAYEDSYYALGKLLNDLRRNL